MGRAIRRIAKAVPFLVVILLTNLLSASAQTADLQKSPLIVDRDSRVVVMEYEAWFGPNAVTFQGTAAKPILQSPDMEAVGGGYDSADPKVIKKHVDWMEEMDVDAAMIDLTNGVSCTFDSVEFIKKYLPSSENCLALRSSFQSIRDNTGNLYPAWTKLETRLKLIPLLGGTDADVLIKDFDGKTSFEKEIEYFGTLMAEYPQRAVIYQGKPLMVIFIGAGQDPDTADNPLWFQLREFLKDHPEIESKYTFREMAGYLDSQPGLWETQGVPDGPVKINPLYGFWSWVDRLNPTCKIELCPYFPSFNEAGDRAENFTASIATAGQAGWGCPNPDAEPYCEDDSLRYGDGDKYVTLNSFMKVAGELDPIFLMIHQFNEYVPPDEGFDADTIDDIEPTNLWGYSALEAVKEQIRAYRHHGRSDDGDGDELESAE